MGRYGQLPAVREMRDAFQTCPGCGRDRHRIWRDRPNPAMEMNQLLTVEHLNPRASGGTNTITNLLIVCHRCNFTRGTQAPWDWFGAQYLIYQAGWPVPQKFYGKAGRANRRLWENRAAAIAALLGWGPVAIDEQLTKPLAA